MFTNIYKKESGLVRHAKRFLQKILVLSVLVLFDILTPGYFVCTRVP